ncbi:pentapeptide repeat-containing protein [Sphingobacterium sp. ML3W]|uniref:pentapeptide repeat-containing protein n=1 Tax=Sphingobacterium sp. ML3W TaxID=1538644 RepID=UPI00249A777C|nr:pentapeptide repeat-containing protein [Sphingobacterium sp. ML3W]WFA81031.1 pentapeptide repeat-containing protein [Sphingobacterium sp. ML3W]
MNKDYVNQTLALKTKFSNKNFVNWDFTNTNFNSAIFENTNFDGCLFKASILAGSRIFYDSNFKNCIFKKINLSETTFGSHKGVYTDCIFEDCEYKYRAFNFTQFVNCKFIKTKFTTVNFNGSQFRSCIFDGKFKDVTFNGLYDTNRDSKACLQHCDFSSSIFGDFVSFDNCDLSTCTAPKDTTFDKILYQVDASNPKLLSTGSPDRLTITDI